MAVIVNKNTQGTPITSGRLTSGSSIRHIEAPRIYILLAAAGTPVAEVTVACPVQNYMTKSNGVTPTPVGGTNTWADLGIVNGFLKVNYVKSVKLIETGIDQVMRMAYVNKKTMTLEATLDQFSDYVLEKVSGLTASVITSGSIINYQVGQEDLVTAGILLVSQNKIDGQEWQFFNPAALTNFVFEEKGDALALKMTAYCPFFQANSSAVQSGLSTTIFN
jgi:hypothetical protein